MALWANDTNNPEGLSEMALKPLKLALVFLAAFVTMAAAHEDATGVVKERMDLMEEQKAAMKVIGDMAKGKVPLDTKEAAEAALIIEVTAKKIPELFPEGTVGYPSEAKPEIWTQWHKFEGDADALAVAAKNLAAVLEANDGVWKAKFKDVIDACKACHKTFRAEDD